MAVREEANADLVLLPQQEAVAKELRAGLQALLDYDWLPTPQSHTGWWTDALVTLPRKRPNTAFLIDGKRGTGKTTVLLHLLGTLAKEARSPRHDPSGKILPLPILDVHALHPRSDIPALVAARLRPLVEALRDTAQPPPRKGPSERCPPPAPDLEKKWDDLAMAVAARAARPDPGDQELDELAYRLRETSRPEWNLEDAFAALVDEVMLGLRATSAGPAWKAPLLLIPVDDADTQPEKAGDLIEVLRGLYHPRVAFVLTGNSALFRTVLLEVMLRRLEKGAAHFDHVRDRARRLADDLYDRVVPFHHRLRLDDRQEEESLYEAMGRIAVPGYKAFREGEAPADATLRDLFVVTVRGRDGLVHRHQRLLGLIPPSYRGRLDLSNALAQIADAKPPVAGAWGRAVELFWWREVTRRPGIPEPLRRLVRFPDTWTDARTDDARLDLSSARLSVDYQPWRELAEKEVPGTDGRPRCWLRFATVGTVAMTFDGEPVAEELVAAMVMVADLASVQGLLFRRQSGPMGARSRDSRLTRGFASTLWDYQDRVVTIPWPLPGWLAFVDGQLFGLLLERGLPPEGKHVDPSELARVFLAAALQTATRDGCESDRQPSLKGLEPELMAEVEPRVVAWVRDEVGELLTRPEFGLGLDHGFHVRPEDDAWRWARLREALGQDGKAATRDEVSEFLAWVQGSSGGGGPRTVTARLGPGGGSIRAGDLRLVVPEGALEEEVTLRATFPDQSMVADSDLFPDGVWTFEPANLRVDRPMTLQVRRQEQQADRVETPCRWNGAQWVECPALIVDGHADLEVIELGSFALRREAAKIVGTGTTALVQDALTLKIPPGALVEGSKVWARRSPNEIAGVLAGPWQLGPDSLLARGSLLLSIHLAEAPGTVEVVRRRPGGTWEALPTTRSLQGAWTTRIRKLGVYAVREAPGVESAAASFVDIVRKRLEAVVVNHPPGSFLSRGQPATLLGYLDTPFRSRRVPTLVELRALDDLPRTADPIVLLLEMAKGGARGLDTPSAFEMRDGKCVVVPEIPNSADGTLGLLYGDLEADAIGLWPDRSFDPQPFWPFGGLVAPAFPARLDLEWLAWGWNETPDDLRSSAEDAFRTLVDLCVDLVDHDRLRRLDSRGGPRDWPAILERWDRWEPVDRDHYSMSKRFQAWSRFREAVGAQVERQRAR